MSVSYKNFVNFTTVSNTPVCVELPLPSRGLLDSFILTEVPANTAAGTFKIFDRKGASTVATDINVQRYGTVTSVLNSSSAAKVTTAQAHGLKVGNSIEIKGCSVAAYNVTHTVTVVLSMTEVVTNVTYTSNGAGGLWQDSPFTPTNAPITHLVFSGTKAADADFVQFGLNRPYENSDNQSSVTRCRHSALWLEFIAATGSTRQWTIGYTAKSNSVF